MDNLEYINSKKGLMGAYRNSTRLTTQSSYINILSATAIIAIAVAIPNNSYSNTSNKPYETKSELHSYTNFEIFNINSKVENLDDDFNYDENYDCVIKPVVINEFRVKAKSIVITKFIPKIF